MQTTSEQLDRTCLSCKYPLSQLDRATRACPECGRPFDPADPWSLRTGHVFPDRLRSKINEERLRAWLGPMAWVRSAMRGAFIVALASKVLFVGAIFRLVDCPLHVDCGDRLRLLHSRSDSTMASTLCMTFRGNASTFTTLF